MKIKSIYVIAVILLLLGLVWLLGYGKGRHKGDSALNRADSLFSAEISRYNILLDGLQYQVAEKEQIIATQRELIKKGEIARDEMRKLDIKRVNEITRLRLTVDTLIHITSDAEVVYVDTCTELPRPAMLLPFSFEKKDQWLSLKGIYDIHGKLDLSIKIDVPIQIIGAVDKSTKKYKVVVVSPNNSYVRFTDINSSKLDVPRTKKWGVGFFVGYGTSLTAPKLTPMIGFGISRNIIRF